MSTSRERTIGEVLNDIADNVGQIVRAELRLAKAEAREDLVKVKSAAVLFGCSAVAAVLSGAFLLLAAVYALATVVAPWVAALMVGVGALVIAGICAVTAGHTLKKVGAPRTAETIRESIQWAKTRVK